MEKYIFDLATSKNYNFYYVYNKTSETTDVNSILFFKWQVATLFRSYREVINMLVDAT